MSSQIAIQARLGALMLQTVAETAVRRLRRGPRRPGWTFQVETMIAFLRNEQIRHARLPWTEQRAIRDAMGALGKRLPEVRETEATIAGVPGVWLRAADHDETRDPVVVYLHGGSYLYGSLASHRELVSRIAKASGARIFFPVYRLAPEHPFPAALDDACAVTKSIVVDVGASRVVLAGDSAGGGLAVATLLRLRDEKARLPAAASLISPWVELDATGGSLDEARDDWGEAWMFPRWAEAYLGGHDARDSLASPAHGDLRGLPPLRIDCGSAEMVRDQDVRFAERARAAGVEVELEVWPEMVHDFQVLAAYSPVAQRAIDELASFVRKHGAADSRPE